MLKGNGRSRKYCSISLTRKGYSLTGRFVSRGKDATPLPSFEENDYAANAKADNRNWDDLLEEFNAVRRSTEILFASFDNEQLETAGTASGHSNYVLGIGYILAGHVTHHVNVIKERYLAPAS
jgi:hypothetical protein